ncbi:MAG: alpha/beta hydrolase [Lachnospiraceae bacterium]|nr:alpha/beta hydrolase [Lachnospiraceae bacterium]
MRGNLRIVGMQFYPDADSGDTRFPALIVSHGYTGNYSDFIRFCRKFAQAGYAAFCFSFCGGGRFGQPEETKSDGDSRDMSVLSEVEDLMAVKEYVKSRPFVNPEKIVLAGFSQGGFVSGITAARSADVSLLILVYPALAIPHDARLGRMGGAHYDPKNVPEELDCGNTVLGRQFHEQMAAMDPFLELAPYQGPVLILHGTADTLIPCSYSQHMKNCYRPGQCHLQLIEKMGHGQNEAQEDSMIASMKEFLSGRTEVLTIHVIITGSERKEVSENQTETAGKNRRTIDLPETIKTNESQTESTNTGNMADIEVKSEETVTDTETGLAKCESDRGKKSNLDIFFTGYCDTEYFHGVIQPYGCDHREYAGDECTEVCASYELCGLDADGKNCSLAIENRWDDAAGTWKPRIQTESQALAWMNGADLTAVLEDGNNGVVVRVFADV